MLPFIKICCISNVEEAHLAIKCGASALGLVSAMPSGPGVVDESIIAAIAAEVPPPIATFLLTSLQDADSIIEQHKRCRTTTLQLVDRVAPKELLKLRERLAGIKLVQVIHVTSEESLDEAFAIEQYVDALLLDSGNPNLAIKELGGTGRIHDWELSRRICKQAKKPVFLAGGLNSTNVADAVALVKPFGLDLCSGVRSNGKLDKQKLEVFMAVVAGG
jgi:phosphoribosylanthranilate isomerase